MRYIKLLLILPLLWSCEKDKPQNNSASNLSNGILVLCEGLFQQNNSSVSWIDRSSGAINNQYFLQKVGRELGDTGNDIKRYGNKVYIIVNVSSTIEVLNATTFQSILQIPMVDGVTAKQPRNIVFGNGKAYISCYDGYVDILDTTTLTIQGRIAVGPNPEGMTISNNKLYVSNSGGLNFPNMDSTLSVIDLSTETELYKIPVGLNPGIVSKDQDGEVYVITRGDYSTVPSRMVRVDPVNDVAIDTFAFNAAGIEPMNDKFLIMWQDPSGSSSNVALFDPITEQLINPSYIPTSGISTLYNIQYDPIKDRIYISDAMNYTNTGYIRVFSSTGAPLNEYHVGLNPSKLLFYE